MTRPHSQLKVAALSSIAVFFFLLASTFAVTPPTETILHTFSQEPNGAFSEAGLVADAAGNLYGTTNRGGAYGVVFRLSRNSQGKWAETVIHNFTGGNGGPDGSRPSTAVIFDAAGNLYGTTQSGGAHNCGTVFKLAPVASGPWKETILHAFACYPTDGASPAGSLIFDSAGNLYGVTNIGGSGGCGDGYSTYGCGAIYELSPTSGGYTETVIYSFPGNNFSEGNPAGRLAFDQSGNLYGTAQTGGPSSNCYYYGCGTVFQLTKGSAGWTESTIYSFGGLTDGDSPQSGVIFDSAGNLYGTTQGYWGYGSVFELSPNSDGSWSETTLYNSNINSWTYAGVVFDAAGNLYGTSVSGAPGSNLGSIFELSHGSSGWTETTLYSFTGAKDGEVPFATPLRDSAGNLYVTTAAAGVGAGSVFELSPASGGTWTGTALYDFPVTTEGLIPYSGLVADGAGNYYGTTTVGGTKSYGSVFKLTPNGTGGWKETILYNFLGTTGANGDGSFPIGNLLLDESGNIYGTTQLGGNVGQNCFDVNAEQCGTVFKLSPNGNGTYTESILHYFTGYTNADGANPSAGLIMDESGNLYGTTKFGGVHDAGTAFMLAPTSSGPWTETILDSFGASITDATNPSGPLTRDSQGNLYGSADAIHSGGQATVFRLSPSGSSWTESILFTFATQNNGYDPEGGVILDSSGNLYGTAYRGGIYQAGLVYKLTPSSGTWTESVLYNFKAVDGDGGFPQAGLVFDGAGNLYGTTLYGGLYLNGLCNNIGCGTVFELSPASNGSWRERVLHRFAAAQDGVQPYAGVTLDSAGNAYGTASAAGAGASGIVFEIKP